MSANIPELVTYVARALADNPEAVEVTESVRGRQRIVQLKVAPDDLGRVIGRDGRVANALRSLLGATPGDDHWKLEIVD